MQPEDLKGVVHSDPEIMGGQTDPGENSMYICGLRGEKLLVSQLDLDGAGVAGVVAFGPVGDVDAVEPIRFGGHGEADR